LDSIFIISCCCFQHSLSTRKEFNLILILNLWNVLHVTLLSSVVAPATLETNKKTSNLNQNDASVIKVSDYYCLCRLKTMHLYWLSLSALLPILFCALQYLSALAFVTLISDCTNPTDSSRYYELWAPVVKYDP